MNDFFYDDDGQWYPGMDGAYVFMIFILQLKTPKKSQLGKLIRPGIETGPARWEASDGVLAESFQQDAHIKYAGNDSNCRSSIVCLSWETLLYAEVDFEL